MPAGASAKLAHFTAVPTSQRCRRKRARRPLVPSRSRSSHSQTVRTRNPMARSCRAFLRSRARLVASLSAQNAARSWNPTVPSSFRLLAVPMPVPEASVYEDHPTAALIRKIRRSRKRLVVQAIVEAKSPNELLHRELRPGATTPYCSHHPGSRLPRYNIGRTSVSGHDTQTSHCARVRRIVGHRHTVMMVSAIRLR